MADKWLYPAIIGEYALLPGTVNTEAIQSAIDQCHAAGGGNPLDYLSIDAFMDATGQPRGKCLVGAVDAKNISITGYGSFRIRRSINSKNGRILA